MRKKSAKSETARPFLKWVGGKRQILRTLRELYPENYRRYFEPFVGGGAVFFDLNPKRAVLSDINEELLDCYISVRDHVEELVRALAKHKYDKDYYYNLRAKNPDTMSMVARAARMIYLNKSGFNGLYRVNSKGGFNVPFGRHKSPNICDREGLRNCSRRLSGVTLRKESFEKILRRARKGDFVYFDPPYIPLSETSNFTAYQKRGFGMGNQQRLLEVFERLSEREVYVMLSNSDVEWMRKKYARYNIHSVRATRSVNSVGAKRGPVGEVVVTNY